MVMRRFAPVLHCFHCLKVVNTMQPREQTQNFDHESVPCMHNSHSYCLVCANLVKNKAVRTFESIFVLKHLTTVRHGVSVFLFSAVSSMHSQQQPGVGLFFHESAGKIKVHTDTARYLN